MRNFCTGRTLVPLVAVLGIQHLIHDCQFCTMLLLIPVVAMVGVQHVVHDCLTQAHSCVVESLLQAASLMQALLSFLAE